jgi:single-stranded DNA-binding protein
MINATGLVRLTTEPKLDTRSGGKKVLRASVSFETRQKREQEFFTIVAYDKVAESIFKYVKKGYQFLIDEGELRCTRYQQNGETKKNEYILIEHITFVYGKPQTKENDYSDIIEDTFDYNRGY